ncbi:MAG TPA: PBP1A family penicillin-binding protein [Gemmatimonadales bacterium]|nr:PBP1A family penicillin-binding protein [Gemmatimonadales bacterium]
MTLRTTLSRWWHTPKIRSWIVTVVLAGAGFGFALLWGAWHRACLNNACPSVTTLNEYDPDQASKVYAADGRLITDLGGERRTVVPLEQISPAVIAAFLSTEDKRFYSHHGIDWFRVLGTVKNFILHGKKAGASTITMQLAGNIWSGDIDRRDRSPRRKIREAQVALELESQYTKDQILQFYLNQIQLGNGAFGVEAAAERYFGKRASELNVAEAAMLAALPKAPSSYNPRRYQARAIQRRNLVINLMRDNGVLTDEEAERWKAYPLVLSSRSDFSEVAPYFTEYVRQLMSARFGPEIYTSGLRIYTTLDLEVQQAAERALEAQAQAIENGTYGPYPHKTYAQYLQERADKEDQEPPSSSPYLQGLVVSLDPRTGYIRAMVGGRDFDDSKFNRAVQSRRQPGSTFKPIVYSAALRAGHPLSEILVDEPLSVPNMGPNQEPWEPQNYDNQFRGALTLRQALMTSNNIVTIRLGMEELGEQAVIDEATRFGITTPIPSVPSIHIGSADVQPLEMVAAYTAFANLGSRVTPLAILRVEDRQGNILWQPQVRSTPVMPRNQAWLEVDVLRDIIRNPNGTAWGAVTRDAALKIPAGGKTGTTDDGTDVWFIGFTPDLVTGFWMGLDRPERIKNNAAGGILAAPAWAAMMRDVYDRRTTPPDPWPRPDSLVIAEIDRSTGELAWPYCPKELHFVESYLPGTEPKEYCHLHALNPLGGGSPLTGQPNP